MTLKKILFLVSLIFASIHSKSAIYGGFFQANFATDSTSVLVSIDSESNLVSITASGPSDKFFGFGFGGLSMNGTYAFVINSSAGLVEERKLGNQMPGAVLTPSVTVTSSTIDKGRVTVVFERNLNGLTSDYYSFIAGQESINLIYSMGSSQTLLYHKTNRGISSILIEEDLVSSVLEASRPTISLFPNPVSETLNLQFDQEQRFCSVRILDVNGSFVRESQLAPGSAHQLSLVELVPGSYIIEFATDQHKGQYLFVKQ
jgi:hypothetical protein